MSVARKLGFYLYQIGAAIVIAGLIYLASILLSPLATIIACYVLSFGVLVVSVWISVKSAKPVILGLIVQFLTLLLIAGAIAIIL